MKCRYKTKYLSHANITPALIIITGAFLTIIYGILFVITAQFNYSNRQVGSDSALHIAEAGVNYYRWHLAHDPDDYKNGTGQPGPYEHIYSDPQGKAIGKFVLMITAPSAGSSVVTIRSTGSTYQYPKIKRTIKVQYGQPSFARYSFLSSASSWYGTGITVSGLIHSNNGIRMDGTNTSLVTSSQETYICGSETGCSPSQTKPGVWGSGGDKGLWQFPEPPIDFDTISFDYTNMRTSAQNEGIYLAASGARGYHIVFLANGNVNIYKVTSTNYYNGYSAEDGCQRRYERITGETLTRTETLANVPIIFAEDHLWVEGVVKGRSTVVAAKFPIESNTMNVWIPANIIYDSYDQTNSLGIIAQNDIYFTRNIPENFRIDAALMAQKGKIIRHGYLSSCGGTSNAIKDSLTIYGTVISYKKSYWNYGSPPSSGFETRNITYDNNLLYYPPPYFPTTGEYEFISWIEE